MNSQYNRHSIQEELFGSKNHSSKDSFLSILKDRGSNFESSYNSGFNTQKNNFDDILSCFICFQKVKNAQICPNCSKLCCAPCIKKWLTEQKPQCPHCRCSLRVSQLVNCRFVHELTNMLEQTTKVEKSIKKEEESELCSAHQAKMSYFCKTCQQAICADCAMLGSEHKGHEFEHITKIYDSHVELIKAESQGLQKRLKELNGNLSSIESVIEKLKKAKEDKVTELTLVIDQMHSRLDNELKNKLMSLIQQKTSLNDEIEFLESMQSELNSQLTQSAKSHLIGKSGDLIKMLKEINNKPLNKYNNKAVSMEFNSEVIPQFDVGLFVMKSFSKLRHSKEVIYSDTLQSNGLQWRLKVYPNGNGVAKGSYVSVFLEMIKGLQESSKYEYRVEMINHRNPNLVVLREFASEFESGECWGYNKFYKIDLLEKEGYLTESDTITLKYYVRAPTYYQQCQDQRKYIAHMETAHTQSEILIAELKEKLKAEMSKNRQLNDMKQASSVKSSAHKTDKKQDDNEIERPRDINVTSSDIKSELLQSIAIRNTNPKEGSSKYNKQEQTEQIKDGPLDGMSTQKKEDHAALKYSSVHEDEDNIILDKGQKEEIEGLDNKKDCEDLESSQGSAYQGLFSNGLDLIRRNEDIVQSLENSRDQLPARIEELFGTSMPSVDENEGYFEDEKIEIYQNDETIFQDPDGREAPADLEESHDELNTEENQNLSVDEINDNQENEDNDDNDLDLDNICEKRPGDSSLQILANHDIEQLEIDKFLNYNQDVPSHRTQVKKNLLANFEAAEPKKDKKATEKFTASIHQFSENLMKKMESIKSVNDKYKNPEQSDDKRRPLSQSSKLNILNMISLEHNLSGVARVRDYTTKTTHHNPGEYIDDRERTNGNNLF